MDGQQQRRALTAAEQALQALADADASRAAEAAGRAADLDQTGAYAGLPALVMAAADELTGDGRISAEAWRLIAATLGPGPLAAFAEEQAAR
jgi:hypothetical protein